jgi:hypothetical protein
VPRASAEAERKKLQRRSYADAVKAKRAAKKEAAAAEGAAAGPAGVASGATNSKAASKSSLPSRRSSSSSSSYGSYARSFAGSTSTSCGDDGRRSSRLISRNGYYILGMISFVYLSVSEDERVSV